MKSLSLSAQLTIFSLIFVILGIILVSTNTSWGPKQKRDNPVNKEKTEQQLTNLSSSLNQLLLDWSENPSRAIEKGRSRGLSFKGNQVVVTVYVNKETAIASTTQNIQELGGEITSQYETRIGALVPVPSLDKLANLPGVGFVKSPVKPVPLN